MAEEKPNRGLKIHIGPDEGIAAAALFVCLTLLLLFFQGEPDLMDAIIRWILTNGG